MNDIAAVAQVAKELGFPIVVLLACGFGIWYSTPVVWKEAVKWIEKRNAFIDSQTLLNAHLVDSQEKLTESIKMFGDSFRALTRLIAKGQEETRRPLPVVLVLEDQVLDGHYIETACRPLLTKHGLTMVIVRTLGDAFMNLWISRIIIADVIVEDSTPALIRVLIERAGDRPVIIYANDAHDYAEGTFPGAFKIVRKWHEGEALLDALEQAITVTEPTQA